MLDGGGTGGILVPVFQSEEGGGTAYFKGKKRGTTMPLGGTKRSIKSMGCNRRWGGVIFTGKKRKYSRRKKFGVGLCGTVFTYWCDVINIS